MIELEEKDFITGNNTDSRGALMAREDCNAYIDSVLDQIYGLDLTKEEEMQLGIEVHREKYDDFWKMVKIVFSPGNFVIISRRDCDYRGKIYKTEHELTYNGQLEGDRMISILSGFGIVGSHRLFSYQESIEDLNFGEGNEILIKIDDEENLTQYSKLGITKKPKFDTKFGKYSFEYLKRDTYKREYQNVDGDYQTVYFDLEGNPLTQPELIATTYGSFDDAYTSFKNKFMMCRELIDSRLKEITDKKTK